MNTGKLTELAKLTLKARARADIAQKKADALDAERKEAEEALRSALVDAKQESIRVAGYNFTPGVRETTKTTDWDAFWAWARKDTLGVYVQKRPAVKAIQEQWEVGNTIPGVVPEKIPTLHISKAGKPK